MMPGLITRVIKMTRKTVGLIRETNFRALRFNFCLNTGHLDRGEGTRADQSGILTFLNKWCLYHQEGHYQRPEGHLDRRTLAQTAAGIWADKRGPLG